MKPRRPAAALVAVLAAGLAACTPTPGGPPNPGVSPELQRFYAQQLSWGPCGPFATDALDRAAFADAALECSYLEVPLDYAASQARTAQVAVMRKRATDPGARIGSLVTNPGGPGVSGLSRLATTVVPGIGDGEVARRFDLVGFDPRGVGASRPAIDCLTDAERDELRLDYVADTSPAGVAKAEAITQRVVGECVERTGSDVLATAGTRDVARDLDVLRAALGDERLSFLGYSYGTQIGYTYAEAFPMNVRALVLDGAVDPDEDRVQHAVAQAAGFQQAFDAFARWCALRPCPLGQDAGRATAVFQALTRPLVDAPVPTSDGRRLSYPDAITGVNEALYLDSRWEQLRRGLVALAAGDGTTLELLADAYEERGRDGRYSNTLEAFIAIRCVDDEPLRDPGQTLELDRRTREAAPFRDDGRGASAARDPCAFWPVPPSSTPHRPVVSGLPPVVVVSVTGDPATPYQAGVDLAAALGGRLLSVEGNQHTVVFLGDRCVDDAIIRYLVDLTLPADGARCRLG